ncbi:hypothetical protein CBR_g22172 [Chara braunii]|uniref:DUF659 domain-containing protein n=1 Tax=Chara braunii TaxID=69332 RepID=A0A388L273_CHABU|nr:hypothetical protein CBR_g22172 [Chara braunii]|eukprot:GBG76424.1 hypothetical protein CBR_g22172 [Chara braunii]
MVDLGKTVSQKAETSEENPQVQLKITVQPETPVLLDPLEAELRDQEEKLRQQAQAVESLKAELKEKEEAAQKEARRKPLIADVEKVRTSGSSSQYNKDMAEFHGYDPDVWTPIQTVRIHTGIRTIMTKHAARAVKKHFETVKASGAAHKGNKVWRCKFCNHNRTGSASRLRDHFLKGACNVTLPRATISKDELLRREQGRDAAIVELGGALTGAGAELDLSSSEDEIDTEDAVTIVALTKSSTTHGRQTKIIDSAAIITANEETQRTVDDWMTVECVSFNMMRSMYWDRMVKALMNAPKSFQYAKFDEMRTKRVAVTRKRVSERMEQLRKEWSISGCMLQLDGWTDRRGRPFINRREKGAKAYFDILSKAIREIGEEAVVGVVMDNAATCADAGRMVEAEFKHIFSVSCTAHNVDLMLEQFGKIGWVDVILKKSAEVVKFVMNHLRVQELLLVNSHGAILARPGSTRFATNFIMLDSVLVYNRWNQHLLDKLEKKPVEKEDPKKKPWRDGVGGLTAEQLCEDAKKRVQEWRATGDREEAKDCEDEDDDDDDGAHDNGAKASTIACQRATSSLLELERELNKELPSWRKAIRPSKYLARLHLEESQHAGKTMTSEHVEKYINARAQACAPNVKAPAKRPPGRPHKHMCRARRQMRSRWPEMQRHPSGGANRMLVSRLQQRGLEKDPRGDQGRCCEKRRCRWSQGRLGKRGNHLRRAAPKWKTRRD